MDKINDGGPAFPMPYSNEPGSYQGEPGMSLRDYIAVHAMAAIIGKHPVRTAGEPVDAADRAIARGAYSYADAMLAAREGR